MLVKNSIASVAVLVASQALAQETPSGPGPDDDILMGDEIVITGERAERTIRETASSVIVITGDDLESRGGVSDVKEALELVPNIVQTGQQNNGLAIRGQDTTGVLSGVNAFTGGSRPRTTILVDGRPLSFNEYIFGTTPIWDVNRIEAFLGPQTTSQGPNSIAGAIFVETNDPTYEFESAFRALGGNFDTYQGSGMINVPLVDNQLALRAAVDFRDSETFLNFAFPPEPIGTDRKRDRALTARMKLLIEPEAVPDFSAILTYNYTGAQAPQSENVQPPFEDRVRSFPGFAVFETDAHTGIAEFSYDLTDALTLSNRTTFTAAEIERFVPPGQGETLIEQDELTTETVLSFETDRVRALGGVYYTRTEADEAIDLTAFLLGPGTFRDVNQSIGIFGEVTVSPIERLFLTAGLRYENARQDRDGGFAVLPAIDFDENFEAFLPKFGIAYDVSDNLRIGAEVKRGFNPGGVTLSLLTGTTDTFDQETLWNYEAYLRSSFLDGRLDLNANVFFTDFSDAQRPINTVVPGGVITDLSRAEKARSYGAEAQVRFAATDQLTLTGALGLLQTEITEVSLDPTIEGNDFARAPNVTASAGVDWRPLTGLTLSAQARFTSDYFSDDANTAALEVGPFFTADAQVSYEHENARLFLFATNIFDRFDTVQRFGPTLAAVNQPRTFGGGVELRF